MEPNRGFYTPSFATTDELTILREMGLVRAKIDSINWDRPVVASDLLVHHYRNFRRLEGLLQAQRNGLGSSGSAGNNGNSNMRTAAPAVAPRPGTSGDGCGDSRSTSRYGNPNSCYERHLAKLKALYHPHKNKAGSSRTINDAKSSTLSPTATPGAAPGATPGPRMPSPAPARQPAEIPYFLLEDTELLSGAERIAWLLAHVELRIEDLDTLAPNYRDELSQQQTKAAKLKAQLEDLKNEQHDTGASDIQEGSDAPPSATNITSGATPDFLLEDSELLSGEERVAWELAYAKLKIESLRDELSQHQNTVDKLEAQLEDLKNKQYDTGALDSQADAPTSATNVTSGAGIADKRPSPAQTSAINEEQIHNDEKALDCGQSPKSEQVTDDNEVLAVKKALDHMDLDDEKTPEPMHLDGEETPESLDLGGEKTLESMDVDSDGTPEHMDMDRMKTPEQVEGRMKTPEQVEDRMGTPEQMDVDDEKTPEQMDVDVEKTPEQRAVDDEQPSGDLAPGDRQLLSGQKAPSQEDVGGVPIHKSVEVTSEGNLTDEGHNLQADKTAPPAASEEDKMAISYDDISSDSELSWETETPPHPATRGYELGGTEAGVPNNTQVPQDEGTTSQPAAQGQMEDLDDLTARPITEPTINPTIKPNHVDIRISTSAEIQTFFKHATGGRISQIRGIEIHLNAQQYDEFDDDFLAIAFSYFHPVNGVSPHNLKILRIRVKGLFLYTRYNYLLVSPAASEDVKNDLHKFFTGEDFDHSNLAFKVMSSEKALPKALLAIRDIERVEISGRMDGELANLLKQSLTLPPSATPPISDQGMDRPGPFYSRAYSLTRQPYPTIDPDPNHTDNATYFELDISDADDASTHPSFKRPTLRKSRKPCTYNLNSRPRRNAAATSSSSANTDPDDDGLRMHDMVRLVIRQQDSYQDLGIPKDTDPIAYFDSNRKAGNPADGSWLSLTGRANMIYLGWKVAAKYEKVPRG